MMMIEISIVTFKHVPECRVYFKQEREKQISMFHSSLFSGRRRLSDMRVTFSPAQNYGGFYCLLIVLQNDLGKCLVLFSTNREGRLIRLSQTVSLLGSGSVCVSIACTCILDELHFTKES